MSTIRPVFTVVQHPEVNDLWVVESSDNYSFGRYPTLDKALDVAARCATHLSYEECAARYPRLTRCVQWVLIGSQSEAACCIRDYRDGQEYGGEAVSHSGLSPADRVRQAADLTTRRIVRLTSFSRTRILP